MSSAVPGRSMNTARWVIVLPDRTVWLRRIATAQQRARSARPASGDCDGRRRSPTRRSRSPRRSPTHSWSASSWPRRAGPDPDRGEPPVLTVDVGDVRLGPGGRRARDRRAASEQARAPSVLPRRLPAARRERQLRGRRSPSRLRPRHARRLGRVGGRRVEPRGRAATVPRHRPATTAHPIADRLRRRRALVVGRGHRERLVARRRRVDRLPVRCRTDAADRPCRRSPRTRSSADTFSPGRYVAPSAGVVIVTVGPTFGVRHRIGRPTPSSSRRHRRSR